ncbi:cytochrome P450 [Actinoplanes sp. TBRC 11911]|uniref:cytochrome P450 family protein n=1 Tax=Actinoplanes sp. TBRC 11911 TaxID=2729386 RepID=UPI00145FB514|nr:cytochrome P450 [Actinoplanes sp. TBRC 11911]NMO57362.1 cytochrome P450 [Actinoplanes sp. TBRC 11911]
MGDLGSNDAFVAVPDGARLAALRELAAAGPVNRVAGPSGRPTWLVTGYEEARIALTEPRLARGEIGMPFLREHPEPGILYHYMLNMNPPDHTRLRKLVSGAFTSGRVAVLAPRIEAIADELISSVGDVFDRGEIIDLVPAFAYPFPFRVICVILGIDTRDTEELASWFRVMTAPMLVDSATYGDAGNKMLNFLRRHLAEKRSTPGDDLTSDLVRARDGDDRLSEDELLAMLFLLFTAGHETSAGLIANGVADLVRHPDQLSRLKADPALLESAVEEILRFDSPGQATALTLATESFELGGRTIQRGEAVRVSLLAANRDPDHYAEPERLDITRQSAHMAFGYGVHHCLGAPLARLEGRIGLKAIFDRLVGLELVDESLDRVPSALFNRIASLRVRREVAVR